MASKPSHHFFLHLSFEYVVMHTFNWGNASSLTYLIETAISIKHHDIHHSYYVYLTGSLTKPPTNFQIPPLRSALPKTSPTFFSSNTMYEYLVDVKCPTPKISLSEKKASRPWRERDWVGGLSFCGQTIALHLPPRTKDMRLKLFKVIPT